MKTIKIQKNINFNFRCIFARTKTDFKTEKVNRSFLIDGCFSIESFKNRSLTFYLWKDLKNLDRINLFNLDFYAKEINLEEFFERIWPNFVKINYLFRFA